MGRQGGCVGDTCQERLPNHLMRCRRRGDKVARGVVGGESLEGVSKPLVYLVQMMFVCCERGRGTEGDRGRRASPYKVEREAGGCSRVNLNSRLA